MNLTSKRIIKNLLRKYEAKPLKRLGQNFLIDKSVLKKIIEATELKTKDIVLEIGPGIGVITQELAKKVKTVIAIEKDQKMTEILKETLRDFENIEITRGDILKSNTQNLISNIQYKVVANLPFYLTAPVIRKFLELSEIRSPKVMILIVQKEVAQRICSKPPDMNLLAVSVQFYVHPHTKFGVGARPKIISYISKKSFWPKPKVDGAIIKIIPKKPSTRTVLVDLFFKIVKAGFSQPRKQLINNLSKKLEMDKEKVKNWLLKNNIQPSQRAETLSIEDWLNLTKSLKLN